MGHPLPAAVDAHFRSVHPNVEAVSSAEGNYITNKLYLR
jgi:hypothetical protein